MAICVLPVSSSPKFCFNTLFSSPNGTKYYVTWQSEDYDIVRIKRFTIEDTLIAFIVEIAKRFDDDGNA